MPRENANMSCPCPCFLFLNDFPPRWQNCWLAPVFLGFTLQQNLEGSHGAVAVAAKAQLITCEMSIALCTETAEQLGGGFTAVIK
jgi:hypothetical protein